MPSSLDIVIVNWNTKEALNACLRSIEPATCENVGPVRVIVVDNSSSDNSLAHIDDLDLPLVIQRNRSNRGFAAACNQGAKDSKAEYLLFLNPDTRLASDSLVAPIAFMNQTQNDKVGICGIRLLDDRGLPGTCSARFPTPMSMWSEGTGLHRLNRAHSAVRRQAVVKSDVEKVDQVIGAFFLIRRHLFEQLNGFDERFFVYFEEVDLSLRARNAGYDSCVLTNVAAYHTGCVSSDQVKDKRLFYYWRSRLLYAGKHISGPAYFGIMLLTFLAEPVIRFVQAALSISIESALMTARAYVQLIRYLLERARNGYSR